MNILHMKFFKASKYISFKEKYLLDIAKYGQYIVKRWTIEWKNSKISNRNLNNGKLFIYAICYPIDEVRRKNRPAAAFVLCIQVYYISSVINCPSVIPRQAMLTEFLTLGNNQKVG